MNLCPGTKLQMRSFLLCMYGSLTFIIRAIDIKSYGHVLPRPLTSFLSWSCTDSIITILYVTGIQTLVAPVLICCVRWQHNVAGILDLPHSRNGNDAQAQSVPVRHDRQRVGL